MARFMVGAVLITINLSHHRHTGMDASIQSQGGETMDWQCSLTKRLCGG